MDDILKAAENSVSVMLKFFKDEGVPLSYRPKVRYHDKPAWPNPDTCARVFTECDPEKTKNNLLDELINSALWVEIYGVALSKDAIQDIMQAERRASVKNAFERISNKSSDSDSYNRLQEIISPQDMEKGTINIYPKYKEKYENVLFSDRIISHELWHLIEGERGLIGGYDLITEGAARFVEDRVRDKGCTFTIEQCADYNTMIYDGVANVVQKYVGNMDNPFKALFDRDIKDQIQDEVYRRIKPVLAKHVEKEMEKERVIKDTLDRLLGIPEFARLEGNLSAQGIIDAYKDMGATIAVKELEGQNLDKLVGWLKVVGL